MAITRDTLSHDAFWDTTQKEREDIDKYSMSMEELEKDITPELEKKYGDYFDRFAAYVGNGIYTIARMYSTDTRELFLMYIHMREDIEMDAFSNKMQRIKREKDLDDLPF